MLNLSEIFCSIQGESSYAGLPCIFIRLAGCNLRCRYCDSQYTYNTAFTREIPEIIDQISKFSSVKLVEITGGEPLLQTGSVKLMEKLIALNYTVLLETNGSIDLQNVPTPVVKIVDIKCPGSGHEESFLEKNLEFIDPQKDEIKFVLTDKLDYNWAKNKIIEFGLNGHKLIFSPAYSLIDPQDLANWIISDGIKVRMQLQLHKYIWDPETRGV